jgi:23S rRNA pseudouridine955/2504/2580 synthase
MKQTTIRRENAHQRLDKFVRKWLEDAPLSFIYKRFRKKDIKVNGKWAKAEYIVQEHDVITIYVSEEQYADFSMNRRIEPKPFPYDIVHEDDQILIVHKPKGVLVQGEGKLIETTLTTHVQSYLAFKGEYDGQQPGVIPSPAHRLDRQTSGLIVYGKTIAALQALQQLFKEHELSKMYIALVHGRVETSGKISLRLTKDSEKKMVYIARGEEVGMAATTLYDVIEQFQDYTLLKVQIITGRTHQIRVHMKAIQHPVVGDQKYGDFEKNATVKKQFGYEAMFLVAQELTFPPLTGVLSNLSEKKFTIEMDEIDRQFLVKLKAL